MDTDKILLLISIVLGLMVAVWIPFLYSLVYAWHFRVKMPIKFAFISACFAYGASVLIGSVFAFPIGIYLIKFAPQLCETDAFSFWCAMAVNAEYLYEWGSWVLILVSAVVSPAFIKRYYSANV